ncbi:MAG TPA: aldo/keto reductase [Burkholderiaceae bacterium]|nr:aldo/keto reductase [Burkholderiaceae bacterium]
MKTVKLGKEAVPVLGLGTWSMGERARTRADEVAAVRLALQLGLRLIDTAEMYGEGGAEEVVGSALADVFAAGELQRKDVFVVTKVYPHNASRKGAVAACERSLERLGLDYIDLYLLHWRGSHPLAATVAAFEQLREQKKLRHWGVSNFDVDDLAELLALAGGKQCVANQVYYAASQRGIEFDLLPWQRERGIATMAYSPLAQGRLARDATLARIGKRHGVNAAQIALAWVLRQPDVIAIPKTVQPARLREIAAVEKVALSDADLAEIDAAFPPPQRKAPLAMG